MGVRYKHALLYWYSKGLQSKYKHHFNSLDEANIKSHDFDILYIYTWYIYLRYKYTIIYLGLSE